MYKKKRIETVNQILGDQVKIVCLCGSTQHGDVFRAAAQTETLSGNIVLSIGCNTRENPEILANKTQAEVDRVMELLVGLHLQKIAMADEVLILNVEGRIGPSTQQELNYAISIGKPVRYLEPIPSTQSGHDLKHNLQSEVAAWAKVHLPLEADQIVKLREELEELALSPSDPGEIGDLLIGLMVHASNHGIDALAAAADKFEIVKTRRYKMLADGTCRHC